MALNIQVEWHRPLDLYDAADEGLIHGCDLESLPPSPGVYVFGRDWGRSSFTPLYIGKATSLRRRVRQQLEKNVRLMRGIERNVRAGQRQLRYCTPRFKPGQQQKAMLDLIERSLIESALIAGYELINISGTKIHNHTITCAGRKTHHSPFPRELRMRVR